MALTAKKVYAILKRQISDMEAKIKTPIIYRGTVATADLLPLNPDIGDMYNIESKSVYGEAGMNVAWNGVIWDTMGAPIDMSLYIKSSELADWVKQQNKPTYTAEEVRALPADTKIPSKTSDLQNDSGFLTKIPDNYLSGTDKTLSVSGKAADAKTVGDKNVELLANILSKLDKNQGSENFGKIAGINESGDIVPMFPVSVDYNEETNCLEFGSDQKMELNKGINLDDTLTKTGYAADAGAVGEITNSLKEDLGDIDIFDSTNLFNPDDTNIIKNTSISASGKIEPSNAFNISGYIRVSVNDEIRIAQWRNGIYTPFNTSIIGVYKKDKSLISTIAEGNGGIYKVTHSAAYYIRFNYNNSYADTTILTINEPITVYIPYYHINSLSNFIGLYYNNHWRDKVWYAYGTSLTNTDKEGKYPKYVDDFSGLKRVNKANSGQGITQYAGGVNYNAICNISDGKLEADLITIEVGANDTNAPLGNIYDDGDNSSFCGALNLCIRYLQKNTNAQIVVISSTNARRNSDNNDAIPSKKYGTDKHTKYDQWKATEEVCKLNSCYYIPMGENANMSYSRMTGSNKYNVDNIHHTELGGYNLAEFVWSRLKTIPLWHSLIN